MIVLGARLEEMSRAMLIHQGTSAQAILGSVDALKLCSSMTLFDAAGGNLVFSQVLATFCHGLPCPLTLALIGQV